MNKFVGIILIVESILVIYCLAKNKFQAGVITSLKKAFIDKYAEEVLNDPDIIKEEFLKFVSDSRDWAFTYIEAVQEGLQKFEEQVGPLMALYDKFGRLVDSVHAPAMDQIFLAYTELAKFLPEQVDED